MSSEGFPCVHCGGEMVFVSSLASYEQIMLSNPNGLLHQALQRGWPIVPFEPCDECSRPLNHLALPDPGLPKYTWEELHAKALDGFAQEGGFYICSGCGRRICFWCASYQRHVAPKSCHKDDWQTGLCGCCNQPGDALIAATCYYCNLCHGGPGYFLHSPSAEERTCFRSTARLGKWSILCFPFCLPFTILLAVFDLTICPCCTAGSVHNTQLALSRRYGVRPWTYSAAFFCRWCVHCQVRRELNLRGEEQPPYCCGKEYSDSRSVVPVAVPVVPQAVAGPDVD